MEEQLPGADDAKAESLHHQRSRDPPHQRCRNRRKQQRIEAKPTRTNSKENRRAQRAQDKVSGPRSKQNKGSGASHGMVQNRHVSSTTTARTDNSKKAAARPGESERQNDVQQHGGSCRCFCCLFLTARELNTDTQTRTRAHARVSERRAGSSSRMKA